MTRVTVFSLDKLEKSFAKSMEGVSVRARYGLVATAALLAIDTVGKLAQASDGKRDARIAAERQYLRLADNLDLDAWTDRAAKSEAAAAEWANRRWRAATPGLGAAEIEAMLNAFGGVEEIELNRVEVDPTPMAVAGAAEGLRFAIVGTARNSGSMAGFLDALANAEPPLFTDELGLRITPKDVVYFTIGGVAPFERIADETEASPRASAEAS